jgi:hypothetical protein
MGSLISRLQGEPALSRIGPEENEDVEGLVADPHLIGTYAKPA